MNSWEVDPGSSLQRYRVLVLLLCFSTGLQLLTLGNRYGAPDERERVEAAEQLLDHGTLRLRSGAHTKYPPLTSVLTAPGVLLKRLMPGHDEVWLMVPALAAGSACVVPYLWALWAVGIPLGGSVVAGAVFAATNPVWPYTKRLYSEPFTAFFVLAAFAAALRWRTHRLRQDLWLAFGWAMLALGNNSVCMTLFPLLVGLCSVEAAVWPLRVDGKTLRVALALGAAGATLWMLINWLKFGHPLESGYADSTIPNDVFDGKNGFSTPMVVGLYGLLFSGGRGLLVYAPAALLGVAALRWRRVRFKGAALWLFLGGAVPTLVYSMWWSWHGGTCYGPRLLTPFLGLWMLGLAPLLVEVRQHLLGGAVLRALTWGACAWSAVAAFTGTLFMFSYDQQYWIREKPFNDYLDVYTPQYSALLRNWKNAWRFPEDLNFMWLHTAPRGPLTVEVSPNTRVLHLELYNQALRDVWEVTQVQGVQENGARVAPVLAASSTGNAAAVMDGNPATSWVGGAQQKAGQWLEVTFGPEAGALAAVEFSHVQGRPTYPRFARARWGVTQANSAAVEVEAPVGSWSWDAMGWVTLLGLLATAVGIRRWSGAVGLPLAVDPGATQGQVDAA